MGNNQSFIHNVNLCTSYNLSIDNISDTKRMECKGLPSSDEINESYNGLYKETIIKILETNECREELERYKYVVFHNSYCEKLLEIVNLNAEGGYKMMINVEKL